jgi:O-methyltransferase involved in polyketide biosynthesis
MSGSPRNVPADVAVSRWPRALRRGPMETLATVLIAAGVLMLLQPFALVFYTYSFITTLAGVVMFTIVSKFPD